MLSCSILVHIVKCPRGQNVEYFTSSEGYLLVYLVLSYDRPDTPPHILSMDLHRLGEDAMLQFALAQLI